MSKICSIIFFLTFFLRVSAQVPEQPVKPGEPVKQELPTSSNEQDLENITENNLIETEDDSYLQELQQFLKHPINLNTADEVMLKELLTLTPLQIQSLITYRNVFGDLINIYELQAVPAWDIQTIQKIRPFVTVTIRAEYLKSFGERFSGGTHTLLVRALQVVEEAEGYKVDTARRRPPNYLGSPQRLFFRYKYVNRNLLQYGIVGEKDPGEEFFTGSQSGGFDFYSAHLFVRNIGAIKALAIGDFTVNMGQGLTQWQSLAFKKSPTVLNIKRQSAVLRPYSSSGEIYFHRGVGITLGNKNFDFTVFGSYRKLDANFVAADTLITDDFNTVSSLQTSGYHRLRAEVADKNIQTQKAVGGNLAFNKGRLHVGLNGIQFRFDIPIEKSLSVYNQYDFTGRDIGNYSIDYSYTYRNVHFFGEAATDYNSNKAFVNGLLVNIDPTVDMSVLYRNISKGYQSLYTNAFTETTEPSNEKGLFTGISVKPNSKWRFDGYFDFYKFPWLKFTAYAPSKGQDYLIQTTYTPSRQLEIYVRYHAEAKQQNFNPEDLPLRSLISVPKQNLRSQLSYKVTREVTIRNRMEMIWLDKNGPSPENGFLTYVDVFYKPFMKKLSGNVRLQYFETDGFNSRIYAYESDLLYNYSIPFFYDKGYKYYINLNYDVTRNLSVWLKWAQTIYENRETIGSGDELIMGNTKSEIKLQAIYNFR